MRRRLGLVLAPFAIGSVVIAPHEVRPVSCSMSWRKNRRRYYAPYRHHHNRGTCTRRNRPYGGRFRPRSVRFGGCAQGIHVSRDLAMQDDLILLIHDTQIHGSGMEIHAAIILMLPGIVTELTVSLWYDRARLPGMSPENPPRSGFSHGSISSGEDRHSSVCVP